MSVTSFAFCITILPHSLQLFYIVQETKKAGKGVADRVLDSHLFHLLSSRACVPRSRLGRQPLVPSLFDTRRHLPSSYLSSFTSISTPPFTYLLLVAAFSVRCSLSSHSYATMASTPEQAPASPTPDSRISEEHEVQHEPSDGGSNVPSPKKPRRRKSRLLSGLDNNNIILPSPQSQAQVDNEDDDASVSRTQSERRGKERPQREARLSNTRDQYDMKYALALS